MANRRFEEKNAQVLGISVDSIHAHRVFSNAMGNLPYPLLADFHPKGQVAQAFDIWNPERGTSRRAVIIVDKDGIIRYKRVWTQGIPDPNEILKEVEKLG